jgi:GNAT superfamily N-acetyltransferase
VADIPSYFVDPTKGCPATTYFKSAQACGTLRNVSDPHLKIAMLDALMAKYQPEGGHEPFASPIYEKDLKSVRVFGLQVTSVTGKASLGQDKPPEFTNKIIQGLWGRGKPGDLAAIEEICALSPGARPASWAFKAGHRDLSFRVHPSGSQLDEHTRLLDGQYWREQSTPREIRAAILGSTAWVGVVDEDEKLVGAARATSDRTWSAHIFDVVVDEQLRGCGVGQRLVKLLLEHPLVRACRTQKLGTKDATSFYEKFGFRAGAENPLGFESHPMVRLAE